MEAGRHLNCKKSKPIERLKPCTRVSQLLGKHSVQMRVQTIYTYKQGCVRFSVVDIFHFGINKMWQFGTVSDKFKKLRWVPASNSIFFATRSVKKAIPCAYVCMSCSFFTEGVANYLQQLCTAHMGSS